MSNLLYVRLTDYKSGVLTSSGASDPNIAVLNKETIDTRSLQFLVINSYSSGVEQTLSIGSQSTGAGAGKITFNPFSITRFVDAVSPTLFQYSASGTPFKTAEVFITNSQNVVIAKHIYKLVAVKTVAWSAAAGDGGFMESVSFEYGGLIISVNQQSPDGKIANAILGGWNRVKNIKDIDPASIIQ